MTGGWLLLITAALALAALNTVAYSYSTQARVWREVYLAIFQAASSPSSSQTPIPITVTANPDACSIIIFWSNGGALLSTAVTLAFVTTIMFSCSLCTIPLSAR